MQTDNDLKYDRYDTGVRLSRRREPALRLILHHSSVHFFIKKDSTTPFSRARLLAPGSARTLAVAFSSTVAPHSPHILRCSTLLSPLRTARCGHPPHSTASRYPPRGASVPRRAPILRATAAIPAVPPFPAMPWRALSSTMPSPGDHERGPSLAWPRPSAGAADRCQAAPPSSAASWPERANLHSALRRMEEE